MIPLLQSLARITAGVGVGLGIILVLAVLWIRQPILGSERFPAGPRADADRLRRDVEHLCSSVGSRDASATEGADVAAGYILAEFSRTEAKVSRQDYKAGSGRASNILARFGPAEGDRVIVGAHYDVFGDLPGADDNASGTAGLLELARMLDGRSLTRPVELVAYSTEEPPWFGGPEMGSAVHAEWLRHSGKPVRAMIGLEMIGYFSERQPYMALPLYLAYPRHGRFIAIVGRWQDRALVKQLKRCFRGATEVPAVSYSGPIAFGADLSDHRNYWAAEFPAVMVTDTAFWRNRNYHSERDLPATLDYERMAGVVDGVLSAALALQAESDH